MLFLADESCDFAVVRALRGAGHDVLAVADVSPRTDDEQVLELARQEQRILLTEDKDFGRLVYADQQATGGVILIRYPAGAVAIAWRRGSTGGRPRQRSGRTVCSDEARALSTWSEETMTFQVNHSGKRNYGTLVQTGHTPQRSP